MEHLHLVFPGIQLPISFGFFFDKIWSVFMDTLYILYSTSIGRDDWYITSAIYKDLNLEIFAHLHFAFVQISSLELVDWVGAHLIGTPTQDSSNLDLRNFGI